MIIVKKSDTIFGCDTENGIEWREMGGLFLKNYNKNKWLYR